MLEINEVVIPQDVMARKRAIRCSAMASYNGKKENRA